MKDKLEKAKLFRQRLRHRREASSQPARAMKEKAQRGTVQAPGDGGEKRGHRPHCGVQPGRGRGQGGGPSGRAEADTAVLTAATPGEQPTWWGQHVCVPASGSPTGTPRQLGHTAECEGHIYSG